MSKSSEQFHQELSDFLKETHLLNKIYGNQGEMSDRLGAMLASQNIIGGIKVEPRYLKNMEISEESKKKTNDTIKRLLMEQEIEDRLHHEKYPPMNKMLEWDTKIYDLVGVDVKNGKVLLSRKKRGGLG